MTPNINIKLSTQIEALSNKLANKTYVTSSCASDLKKIFDSAEKNQGALTPEDKEALKSLIKSIEGKTGGPKGPGQTIATIASKLFNWRVGGLSSWKKAELLIGDAKSNLPFLKTTKDTQGIDKNLGNKTLNINDNRINDHSSLDSLTDQKSNSKDGLPITQPENGTPPPSPRSESRSSTSSLSSQSSSSPRSNSRDEPSPSPQINDNASIQSTSTQSSNQSTRSQIRQRILGSNEQIKRLEELGFSQVKEGPIGEEKIKENSFYLPLGAEQTATKIDRATNKYLDFSIAKKATETENGFKIELDGDYIIKNITETPKLNS